MHIVTILAYSLPFAYLSISECLNVIKMIVVVVNPIHLNEIFLYVNRYIKSGRRGLLLIIASIPRFYQSCVIS